MREELGLSPVDPPSPGMFTQGTAGKAFGSPGDSPTRVAFRKELKTSEKVAGAFMKPPAIEPAGPAKWTPVTPSPSRRQRDMRPFSVKKPSAKHLAADAREPTPDRSRPVSGAAGAAGASSPDLVADSNADRNAVAEDDVSLAGSLGAADAEDIDREDDAGEAEAVGAEARAGAAAAEGGVDADAAAAAAAADAAGTTVARGFSQADATSLSRAYLRICSDLGAVPMTSVSEQILANDSRLCMIDAYVSDANAKALAMVMLHFESLASLEIVGCKARDSALAYLLSAAVYCPLVKLDLARNRLGELGLMCLVHMLKDGAEPAEPAKEGDARMTTPFDHRPSSAGAARPATGDAAPAHAMVSRISPHEGYPTWLPT